MESYEHRILGYENQILELFLEPGQSIQTEKGAMTYMDSSITMNTRMGKKTGLFSAVKRKVSGEDLLINEFVNNSNHKAILGLSPQKPSHIMMVPLDDDEPSIVCKRDTFLAGDPHVAVDITRGALGPAMLGGGQLIMQKLHGVGQVFITGNGVVVAKKLKVGQTITADLEAVIAFQDTVQHNAKVLKGVANQIFGGESLMVITTTGPGIVWFQSISHFKVADSHFKALMHKEAKLLRQNK